MADSGMYIDQGKESSSCPPCLQIIDQTKSDANHATEMDDSSVINDPVEEKINCSLCDDKQDGDVAEATLHCKDENVFLCNDCGRRHKLDDTTKSHTILRLQDDKMICDLCLDSSIIGYGYCQDCKDLEVFCLPCSRRHCTEYVQHTICTDLTLMRKCERSSDNIPQDCEEESIQDISGDGSRVGLFQKETCIICREESKIVANVCISCKTRLCEDCSVNHNSEDHQTVLLEEFLGGKFPCLTCNADAYYHCNSCSSDFCHECRADHQANGLLDHEWVDIISHAFILSETILPNCSRCPVDDDVPASAYCISCETPLLLCDKCSKEHKEEYADHDLCYDIRDYAVEEDYQITAEEDHSSQNRVIKCAPCTFDQDDNEAVCFCLTCKEPEPMCDKCKAQHIREKKTRGHKICHDMEKFTEPESSSKVICENCIYSGTKHVATGICLTCKEPTPMCDDCATLHLKQKQNHRISSNIQKKRVLCEPCSYENIENDAVKICLDCEDPEPMCQNCANQHLKQRSGRGHTLSGDMNKMAGLESASSTATMAAERKFFSKGTKETKTKTPGKPKTLQIRSDSVKILWTKSEEMVDYYQIRYKSKGGEEKWKFAETDINHNQITISGLMADTMYVFQVRGVYKDQEGSYGPANDAVKTDESLATYLLKFSVRVDEKNPPKYQLLTQERKTSRNLTAKTRKLILGNPYLRSEDEKTILLVGATGSGKSTLVDGIVNYVMGVSFDDPFRFTLVQLEEEERKTHNQALSQTEWITVYKIAPQKGSRLPFTLNIIDTPGFGDTRGIDRDHAIVDQIRYLFSAKGDQGVLFLDAVCFIVKAPDARLTISQKYIFGSIMSLFGKDIESNICTLITFADGAEPPVLASLTEANLPFGSTFQFNNSALFAENKNLSSTSLSPMFWEMGCNSFQKFFKQLRQFETKSLSQTKDVLQEREQLKMIIANILPQVKAGLSKLAELRDQLEIFKKHKDDIENNKDFTYEVEETKQFMVDLPQGKHVTNCLQCNVTCHEDCAIADDAEKSGCWAMTNGYCRICVGKCFWSDHKNTPYIFKYVVEKVTKTYTEMKEKYEKAKGSQLTYESYIEELTYDVDYLFENVNLMMSEMKNCKARLKEIALRPDPLSVVEHIDLMIQAEDTERQPGYRRRMKMLNEIKRMALVDKQVENFDENLQQTKDDISSAVGKTFKGSGRAPKKGKGNVFKRGVDYLKSFF